MTAARCMFLPADVVFQVSDVHPRAVQSVLLDLPGLLFFTTYTLLVLFWAEIFHQVNVLTTLSPIALDTGACPARCCEQCFGLQARSLPTASLRPMFMVFNAVVYAVQAVLWVLAGLAHSDRTLALLRVVSSAFIAVVSISAAIGFLLYGGRLFLMLRRCRL